MTSRPGRKGPTRAATYARTSTDGQQSCSSQQALCRQLIDQRGWRHCYKIEDAGEKGWKTDRPGYQRLLDLAEMGRIDVIVIWKLDRLFRSLKEASIAQELFADLDVSLVSFTEPFDTTTSVGRFVFGFLANAGQFETDLIRERVFLGYERRVREGKWTGSHKPFGYAKDATGALSVEAAERETLAWMFNNYGKVPGDAAMAERLNDDARLWRGQPWTADRVRRALTNPVAKGELTQRGVSKNHPHLAIVSDEAFMKVAALRRGLHGLGRHRRTTARSKAIDAVFDSYMQALENEEEIIWGRGGGKVETRR